MANDTFPTQSQDPRTEWIDQPLTMPPPDRVNLMRGEIRSLRSLRAGQLALLPLQDEAEIEVLEWYDWFHELLPHLPALPPQDEEELEALLELNKWQHEAHIPVLPPLPLQDVAELDALEGHQDQNPWRDHHSMPSSSLLQHQDEAEVEIPRGDILLERHAQHDNQPPHWHSLPDIDPSSPLGVQAIQHIRDYFHIPPSIPSSGFQEFWWAHPKLRRGMTEDRTLASHASTHRGSTSRARTTVPSDLLDGLPDWYFGENVFLMRSSDEDIWKRIEISDLCDRILWHKHKDAWEDGINEWQESEEDDEDDEELERTRQAAVDAISQDIPNSQLDAPLEISLDASIPDLLTHNDPKLLTSSRESCDPVDDSYSDSDSNEEEDESGTRITTISAPILEDSSSPYNVVRRSLLREELVLVDWDESGRDNKKL